MTDMGEVSRILGMEVMRDYDEGTLAITQTAYVDNILERFGVQDANAAHTPGYGPELSAEQSEGKLLGPEATKLYQSITGSLLYLAQCTRYDLCYAVNQLTRACSKPAEIHMTAAKHALRYLRGTTTDRVQAMAISDGVIHRRIIRSQPRQPQVDDKISLLPRWRIDQLRIQDAATHCTIDCRERASDT